MNRNRPLKEYDFDESAEIENPNKSPENEREDKSEKKKKTVRFGNSALWKNTYFFLSKFGYTVISVETKDCKNLFNALREYEISNVEKKDGNVNFRCLSKDSEKIIALLNSLCYNHCIIKRSGVLRALSFLKRQGIVAGLFCIILALAFYSQIVLNVEIDGILNDEVKEVLERNGVSAMKLARFDEKTVEMELLSLDGVAFASVDKVGTRVHIRILPELGKEDFVSIAGGRVVAKKSAEISRVVCFDGTAVVEKGQRVNAGDTMIAPYVLVGEVETPSVANGEVYGFVTYKETQFFPDEIIVRKEGKRQTKSTLAFFGKEKELEFSGGDLKITKYKSDFLLPYTLTTYSFVPVTYEYAKNEMNQSEMQSNTLHLLLEKIRVGTVVDADTKIERAENGYVVTATVKTEELIS